MLQSWRARGELLEIDRSALAFQPDEIDVVLCTTEEWKEYLLWTAAIDLAHRIGAYRAWGMDVHMRCATTVGALKLARDLMRSDPEVNTVLIAGGYKVADVIDLKNPRTSFMFNISGGAPCPPALIRAWTERKGVIFRQGYGLTEVGTNCFSMTDVESVARIGSVGKPILHSEMRLVDPETGADVAEGQAGELLIRGPHVCLGYWGNPEATAEAIRDGWFHTGDSARRDADGFYTIAGRYKDMIKSGGENIYAAEVEAVFREHDAVADAALIDQPDSKWGEVGLMVVMLKPGAGTSVDEFLALCQGRLARYKIPKRVVFGDLPYSPYGKVIKQELRARYVTTDIV